MHQPSLEELDSVTAHTNPLSHKHEQSQAHTDQINGYLPPHQEVLRSRWPMEESTHSQDIQLHVQTHPLSISLMFAWVQPYLYMYLRASGAVVFTPTSADPT